MWQKSSTSLSALAVIAVVGAGAAGVSMMGQSPAKSAQPAPSKTVTKSPAAKGVARTSWGDPDLQGTWFVDEGIPLERSAANAGKEFLTDAEIKASDEKKADDPGRNRRSSNKEDDVSGAYNAVFNSVLKTGRRTSLIIDPPDGRIPPLVNAGGRGRGRGFGGGRGGGRGPGGANFLESDNPETLAQNPRCLGVESEFLPLNTLFAQGTIFQIVQSPKSMGIYMEDDHAGGGNRVIYMDGRPHLPADIKLYLGDSRGHWEGSSLVIETTNFASGFRGANPDSFKMVEKLTRVDASTLRREVTFIDPKTWTRPWTVMIEMKRAPSDHHMIFDSACHEGNYAMTGMLVGARRDEQKAAADKNKK